MRRRRQTDPVPPALHRYVLEREAGCIVAILAARGEIPEQSTCRDRAGLPVDGRFVRLSQLERVLTAAHVRDRHGGRTGKRPPSTVRRLVATCWGHHLGDPVVDRAEVRPIVDRYLEEREGPDLDASRPWEIIRRVREAIL